MFHALPLWLITGRASSTLALTYADALESLCVSVSYYEDPASPATWVFEGLVEGEPDREALQAHLKQNLPVHVSLPDWTCTPLPQCDWLQESYNAFPPLTIGNLYLYGSHHTNPLPLDKHCLLIDAATAFGSGHHATTAGCLVLLQELARNTGWKKPLDLGCGSGILAMAIALANRDVAVCAVDNDPEAVRVAQTNVSLNHLEGQVSVFLSEGLAQLPKDRTFDLIVANILAGPLISLAPEMQAFVSSGGHVILSGFLEEQQDSVQKAYEKNGFRSICHHTENRWVSLCLKRL